MSSDNLPKKVRPLAGSIAPEMIGPLTQNFDSVLDRELCLHDYSEPIKGNLGLYRQFWFIDLNTGDVLEATGGSILAMKIFPTFERFPSETEQPLRFIIRKTGRSYYIED